LIYLLDANVLIDSNRDYYPLSRVPEFWEWLLYYGQQGNVKTPIEIYEEVKNGNDDLAEWMKQEETQNALLLNEDVEVATVANVIDQGYASDLTDDEVEKIGRDPFLVAHALRHNESRCVVTTEISKPSKQRANRKLPDVCRVFSVRTCHTFQFIKELDFSTNWRKS
jgi:hypothetical protein